MKKIILIACGTLALSLLSTSIMAAVSAEEAAKLGTSLTPLGGVKRPATPAALFQPGPAA